ncbi:hypothetical protein BN1200_440132 [Klebsiella variicola]|nr:hypothetical protein BN1200_440132 [Klebsiella variicola]
MITHMDATNIFLVMLYEGSIMFIDAYTQINLSVDVVEQEIHKLLNFLAKWFQVTHRAVRISSRERSFFVFFVLSPCVE